MAPAQSHDFPLGSSNPSTSLQKTMTDANDNGNIDASLSAAAVHKQQRHEDDHLVETASGMIDLLDIGGPWSILPPHDPPLGSSPQRQRRDDADGGPSSSSAAGGDGGVGGRSSSGDGDADDGDDGDNDDDDDDGDDDDDDDDDNDDDDDDGGNADDEDEEHRAHDDDNALILSSFAHDDQEEDDDDEGGGEGMEDEDSVERYDELGELGQSYASLLSSLSAASPLTLSASDLSISLVDIFQKSSSVDISWSGDGRGGLCVLGMPGQTTSPPPPPSAAAPDSAETSGMPSHWRFTADDGAGALEADDAPPLGRGDDGSSGDAPEEEDIRTPAAEDAASDGGDCPLAVHVGQRIDARTNFDCFTGYVDGVTGHLLRGTMIYRHTGAVYRGPFVTGYHLNHHIEGGSSKIVASSGDCAIPLRHGRNATCTWSDGTTFRGSFECDRPKSGSWSGADGWTYDGPVLAVVARGREEEDGCDGDVPDNSYFGAIYGALFGPAKSGGGAAAASSSSPPPTPSIGGCDVVVVGGGDGNPEVKKHPQNAIGVPPPGLPGSVLFHGRGRFARPADGSSYEGEFANGLANGVGTEILPRGGGTYVGEFRDGLRHGVGTLMEDYFSDDDDGDRGSGAEDRLGSSIGEFDDRPAGEIDCDGGDVDIGGDQSVDTGPDFAAGVTKSSTADNTLTPNSNAVGSMVSPPRGSGSNSSSAPRHRSSTNLEPKTPRTLNPPSFGDNHRQVTNGKKKQRVFSGVWCAGQLEIEDCRGTVHPDKNEFREESHADVAIRVTASTASGDGSVSARGDSTSVATSLNRTTWDMLDGKWLGF